MSGIDNVKPMGIKDKTYDYRQYAMIMYCSYKGDSTLWNDWRKSHIDEPIFLDKVNLSHANLQGANLMDATLQKANLVWGSSLRLTFDTFYKSQT